eukprot:CAMPEP_0113551118 /NCGR_PEP_ID=MMETSP0015_2-20120614/14351_1 /TAXON_ID=2838 /ORGANISM="Odontella" /LENGTH=34 /DNA_ID=CAMNT_0000451983 /DNA_START=111 /DNA_END=212 /DNA_ORIENTATION=- /assembly_acc=CAM_ASM_000160
MGWIAIPPSMQCPPSSGSETKWMLEIQMDSASSS